MKDLWSSLAIQMMVVSNYLSTAIENSMDRHYENIDDAPGNDRIRVMRVRVTPSEGDPSMPITMMTPISVEFEYWNLKPSTHLNLSLVILTVEGITVFNTVPVHDHKWLTEPYPQGLFRSVCRIPGYLLNSGTYRVTAYFIEDQARTLFRMDDALIFDVAEAPEVRGAATWFGRWPGVVHPRCEWETRQISHTIDAVMNL